jgi:hypothetical protein
MSQEEKVEQSEAEILRQELDDFFDKIREIVADYFEEWYKAEQVDEILKASYNFNHHNIISQIKSKHIEIENWYVNKHNALIKEAANDKKISAKNWLLKYNSFLLNQLNAEILSLDNTLAICKSEMTATAEYIKEHSGVGGLVTDFLRGYNDPIDAIMGIFGKSSIDKEAEQLDKNFKIAIDNAEHALEVLIDKIDDVIVTKWNTEYLTFLEEIENFVPPKLPQPPQKENTVQFAQQLAAKTTSSPILGFIIAGFVIGIVIVGGIGLLHHFGLF